MLREQYTNAVATQLNGAINNSTTTVVVDDASTFPSAGYSIVVESEIMYVTSKASNTLTVVRAQEGTSAASHADNTPCNHIITKGALDRYRIGILSDVGMVPYTDSLSADDDEFDDDNFSGWTAVAGSPALVSTLEKSHKFSVVLANNTANAQHYAWMKAKTPSAGKWIQAGFQFIASGNQYPMPGLFMADGATYNSGNQTLFCYSPNEANYFLRATTGYNTHVGNDGWGAFYHHYPFATLHMRMQWNSANNYDVLHSLDGLTWATMATGVSRGSVGTPTHMGFGFTSWGAGRETQFAVTYCRFNF